MTFHRFFIDFDKAETINKELRISDVVLTYQLLNVLRKKSNDQIILLDNKGNEYLSEIRLLTSQFLIVKVLEKTRNQNEPEIKINLYHSLIKPARLEWMFEKATEIGVSVFSPILSSRSEIKNFKNSRSLKILKEAAEQCERGLIPKINEIKKFKDVIGDCDDGILFDRSGSPIKSIIRELKSKNISVFIGPEGGWSEDELKIARDKNFKIINLGKRVLRAETAAIIACSMILNG